MCILFKNRGKATYLDAGHEAIKAKDTAGYTLLGMNGSLSLSSLPHNSSLGTLSDYSGREALRGSQGKIHKSHKAYLFTQTDKHQVVRGFLGWIHGK